MNLKTPAVGHYRPNKSVIETKYKHTVFPSCSPSVVPKDKVPLKHECLQYQT